MHLLSKETAKRSRTISYSRQGKQSLKRRHAKNQFYWENDAATPAEKSGLRRRSSGLSAWNAPWVSSKRKFCPRKQQYALIDIVIKFKTWIPSFKVILSLES